MTPEIVLDYVYLGIILRTEIQKVEISVGGKAILAAYMPPLSIHNNCCDHLPVKTKLCNLVQCSVPGLQSQEYTPPVWSLSFDTQQRVRRKASCLQVIAWSLVQDISSFSLPPHVPFSLHPITYPPSISTPSLILLSPPPQLSSFSLHPLTYPSLSVPSHILLSPPLLPSVPSHQIYPSFTEMHVSRFVPHG